jgi:hypothetical protein
MVKETMRTARKSPRCVSLAQTVSAHYLSILAQRGGSEAKLAPRWRGSSAFFEGVGRVGAGAFASAGPVKGRSLREKGRPESVTNLAACGAAATGFWA